ncbi:type IV secretory system conjugative DNA transfer family protein [Cryobacterium sp. AP23]
MDGWRLFGAAAKGTWKASNAISGALTNGIEHAAASRGSGPARSGVLGPGDSDPPPNSPDFFDYRGISRPKDLRHLVGLPFTLGRVRDVRRGLGAPIGLDGNYLARHAAVIGPSGSGKTRSIIVPWIASALQAGNSVVAVDVTGDLLEQVLDYRAVVGPLGALAGKWDFSDPNTSVSWNWLADLDTDDSVIAAVDALIGRENPNDPQPFFAQRDRRVLRGLIDVVRQVSANPQLSTLINAATNQSMFKRLVALAPRPETRLAEVVQLDPADFGKAMSGIVNALDVFDNSDVRHVTSRIEFTKRSIFDRPSLIVIGAPLKGGRTSVSLSSLMISQIVRELYTRFGQSSPSRVFLFLDEAARLTDRINFEELLSVSRGAGISVVLAAQTVSQFRDPSERAAILDNCATFITLPTPSKESADYFISRLGQRQQSTLSTNLQVGGTGRSTTAYSRSSTSVAVLGHREVMDPPWGGRSALVHCAEASSAPILVDLGRPDLGAVS